MNQRFLTLNTSYIPKGEHWLMIADYIWWNKNLIDIKLWAEQCLTKGSITESMIVKFVNAEDRNLFIMRWANE